MSEQTTILFPIPAHEVWKRLREIVQTELQIIHKHEVPQSVNPAPGFTVKPIYTAKELCQLLKVSRQTLHEWCKEGILRPRKLRSRNYYLWGDLEKVLAKSSG